MYKIPSGNLVEIQAPVLEKWKNENSFKESINIRDGSTEFIFYDGPPFANGLPHYGHLLTSYIKDTVARFQTQIGKKVERRFGWDCHGLPAEMEAEKELGISGRVNILKYGIDKFNDQCRSSVMKYSENWKEYIEKAGRWVDFDEDYKTMDISYMESVIWGFKQLFDKGLLYEDFRVMPYSWKAETPLSNFETRMDNSYREIKSKTLTVKFELLSPPKSLSGYKKVYVAIWTTTAWTLPSNLAIAVNKDIDYVAIKTGDEECVIISKKLLPKYEKELGKDVILELKGKVLIGLSYKPLFRYFETHENSFKILHGDFVEDQDGTGLVHMAPGFGEDDWALCKENDIKIVCPVDDSGKFTAELYPYIKMETNRLKFQHVSEEDSYLIETLTAGHSEMEFAGVGTSFYTNHLKKFGTAPMVIILKATGEKIGVAGIISHDESLPLIDGNIEIICFLLPKFHEKGYGKEAFNFFVKYAFARFNTQTITAVILEGKKNIPSHKMLTDFCGFDYIGEIKDPRAQINVHKYLRTRAPKYFCTMNIEFKKEGNVPEALEHNLTEKTYFVHDRKTKECIGAIELINDTLSFSFLPQVSSDIRSESIQEFINTFAFGEVFFNGSLLPELKAIGFFESKEEGVKRHSEVLNLMGRQVFEAADDVTAFLKYSGNLIKQEQYIHNYPHCWRTDTPLIYKAVSSWYVEVTKIKDRMVELNKQINWIPSHIREGQFGKWIANARDWSITRNRFWGCPVPVWKSDNPTNKELYVFGSISEMEEFFGTKITDLHRPFIDTLEKPDPFDPKYKIRRIADVLDCWFESGSMPFASVHYPFENKDWFETHNTADFIVEYIAQTRGWFYTLMVLSTAIFDRIPFKTCLCHGVILDINGQKLSKRLRNYPDPLEVFDTHGSDAMRWFLLSSPVIMGGDLNISKEGVEIRDAVRLVIKPIWNAYTFFAMYANSDVIKATYSVDSKNIMDIYILSKISELLNEVHAAMINYDFSEACKKIEHFIDILNNWYIRRNKERFWKTVKDEDKASAYNTLYSILYDFAKIIAPLLPFTSEALFSNLSI